MKDIQIYLLGRLLSVSRFPGTIFVKASRIPDVRPSQVLQMLMNLAALPDDLRLSLPLDLSRWATYGEAVRAHLYPEESAAEAGDFWESEFGESVRIANDDVARPGDRDRPLGFDWKVDKEAVARTGYVESGDKDDDRAMMSIMTQLVRAGRAGEWVSYSRSRDFYRAPRRYVGIPYIYARILRCVEVLLQLGLIEEQRVKPGSHNERQSRMRATEKLIAAFEGAVLVFQPAETIRLRDDEGRPAGYDETGKTITMRREIDGINAFIRCSTIELPDEDVVRKGDLLIVDGAVVRTGPLFFYRSFCRSSFTNGGRLYWFGQNLPSARRKHLLVDGKPVYEFDFKAMHIDMLHARRGVRLEHDPYAIQGVERSHAKLALLVVINARTRRQAICALIHARLKDGSKWPYDYAGTSHLIDRIIERNPTIADDVCSDRGVRLMHDDSEIALRVIKACMRKGIVCLPVHDSFIVQRDHKDELIVIATAEMERYRSRVAPVKKQVISSGNIKRNAVFIPTEGDRAFSVSSASPVTPPAPVPSAPPVSVRAFVVDPDEPEERDRRWDPRPPVDRTVNFAVDARGWPVWDRVESARRQEALAAARETDPSAEYFLVPGEGEWLLAGQVGLGWRRESATLYRDAYAAFHRGEISRPPQTSAERAANRRLPVEEGGSGWRVKPAKAAA